VSTLPAFSTTIVNDSTMTDTVRALTALNYNTQHYWRVRARNNNGRSGWTEVWNFRTAPAPPATPTLISPPNNATSQPSTLALQWSVVIGATSFHVQVAVDSLFGTTIVNDSTVTTTQRNVTVSTGTTYYWRVRARNAGGPGSFSAIWNFTTLLTPVPERPAVPAEFALSQNYPNPFNPSTVIEFALPRESFVSLEIYNLLGERVAVLVDGKRPAGYYSTSFRAEDLANGLYFYRMNAGTFMETRKLILLR
jgi:hypothetical protein